MDILTPSTRAALRADRQKLRTRLAATKREVREIEHAIEGIGSVLAGAMNGNAKPIKSGRKSPKPDGSLPSGDGVRWGVQILGMMKTASTASECLQVARAHLPPKWREKPPSDKTLMQRTSNNFRSGEPKGLTKRVGKTGKEYRWGLTKAGWKDYNEHRKWAKEQGVR